MTDEGLEDIEKLSEQMSLELKKIHLDYIAKLENALERHREAVGHYEIVLNGIMDMGHGGDLEGEIIEEALKKGEDILEGK